MKSQVQRIGFEPAHVSTNCNIFRQRELSYPQKCMVQAASVIAAGDLHAVKALVKHHKLYNCEVSQGEFEIEGTEPSKLDWYRAHAIRITASSKKAKKPWIEFIYNDPSDAKAVIAAVNE